MVARPPVTSSSVSPWKFEPASIPLRAGESSLSCNLRAGKRSHALFRHRFWVRVTENVESTHVFVREIAEALGWFEFQA